MVLFKEKATSNEAVRELRVDASIISRCYVVAMCNMQHNALNLIFCTGPEALMITHGIFEKVNAVAQA